MLGLDVEFISDMRHDGSEVALVQAWLPDEQAAAKPNKRTRGGKSGKKGVCAGCQYPWLPPTHLAGSVACADWLACRCHQHVYLLPRLSRLGMLLRYANLPLL